MDRVDSSLVALRRILRATEMPGRELAQSAGLTSVQLRVMQAIGETGQSDFNAHACQPGHCHSAGGQAGLGRHGLAREIPDRPTADQHPDHGSRPEILHSDTFNRQIDSKLRSRGVQNALNNPIKNNLNGVWRCQGFKPCLSNLFSAPAVLRA